jgi:Holliday junction resolvase RusA-like endonuclease
MDNFLNIPNYDNKNLSKNSSEELTIQINTTQIKEDPIKTLEVELTGGDNSIIQNLAREYEFDVDFPPTSLKRHRHTKFGNHTYDPSAGEKKEFLKKLVPTLPKTPLSKPIKAELYFYEVRPKSHYRTGKYAGELKPAAPKYNVVRKDIDNFVKFVFDSLNKHLYNDDSQIFELVCGKYYSDREYAYIKGKFSEIEE